MIWRLVGTMFMGGVLGILQTGVLAGTEAWSLIDLALIGTLFGAAVSGALGGVVIGVVSGGVLDYMAGWNLPFHALAHLIAALVFVVLARRVFYARTWWSAVLNGFVAGMCGLGIRFFALGIDVISVAGGSTPDGYWWWLGLLRAGITAAVLGVCLRFSFRRGQFIQSGK